MCVQHGEGCATSSFAMVTKATVDAKRKNAAKRLRNVYAASSKIAAGTREKDVAARNATRIPARNADAEGARTRTDVAESQRREEVRASPRSRLRTRAHGRPLTSDSTRLQELSNTQRELLEARKTLNDIKCQAWLRDASGKSTVLALSQAPAAESGGEVRPGGADEQPRPPSEPYPFSEGPGSSVTTSAPSARNGREAETRAIEVPRMRLSRPLVVRAEAEADESSSAWRLRVACNAVRAECRKKAEKKMHAMRSKMASAFQTKTTECVARFESDASAKLSSLEDKISRIAALEGAMQTAQTDATDAVKRSAHLNARVENLERKLRESKEECEALHSAAKCNAERHTAAAAAAAALTKDLQAKLKEQECHASELGSRLRLREADFETMRAAAIERDARLCTLQSECEARDGRLLRVDEERRAQEEEAARVVQAHQDAQTTITELRGEVDRLTSSIDGLGARNAELLSKQRNAEQKAAALEQRLERASQAEAESASFVDEARFEIERQSERIHDLETDATRTKDALESAERSAGRHAELRTKYEALRSKHRGVVSELDQSRTEASKRLEESGRLRKELEACKESLRRSQQRCKALKEKADQAEASHKHDVSDGCSSVPYEEYKHQLHVVKEEAKHKSRQAAHRLAECRKDLAEALKGKAESEEHGLRLREGMCDAKSRIRSLEAALKKSQDKCVSLSHDLSKLEGKHEDVLANYKTSQSKKTKQSKASLQQVVLLQSELLKSTHAIMDWKERAAQHEARAADKSRLLEARDRAVGELEQELCRVKACLEREQKLRAANGGKETPTSARNVQPLDEGLCEAGSRRAQSTEGIRGSGSTATASRRKADGFERMLNRLKRINKKFRLRVGKMLNASGNCKPEQTQDVLANLVGAVLTALDNAVEPTHQPTPTAGTQGRSPASVLEWDNDENMAHVKALADAHAGYSTHAFSTPDPHQQRLLVLR